MGILQIVLGIAFCLTCALLMLVILLQRGRGGGLSGAFGGVGGHSAFGSKTGDVFTWVTVGFVAVYLLLAVFLNYAMIPEQFEGTGTVANQTTTQPTAPAKDTTTHPSPIGGENN
jgi:preprotein translocase subunit SecG